MRLWDNKPKISTRDIHILDSWEEGVFAILLSLEPAISTTTLSHFMVTQVCDGTTSLSKREEKGKNENNPLATAVHSHLSFLQSQRKPVGSNLTADLVTTHNIAHLENQGHVTEAHWICKWDTFTSNGLKSYHCRLSRLKNVSLCGGAEERCLSYLLLILNNSY